ncbi:hypothetical protein [Mesorhizobium xinjiangense]|uniref:hypothetical protein n=1 Tax=Mesorhizobium xinjiangense TaxID=2678685 RepID=UPI0012ED8FC9|nr:hypothetical protein [Mesorhizobium xinjiangense]
MTVAAHNPAMSEGERLREIRAALEAIEPGRWQRAADAEGELVEAFGEQGELLPIARFHPGATADEVAFITDAPAMVRFLLGLVDRAIAASRAHGRAAPSALASAGAASGEDRAEHAGKNYSAEAAMKCQEPAFKRFLHERHGLDKPMTTERTAQKLRSLLGVTSRADINNGGEALTRWKRLRGEFFEWIKEGRG